MIWICACGGEGVVFYPGSEPEVAELGFVIAKGEPSRVLCLPHFQRAYPSLLMAEAVQA